MNKNHRQNKLQIIVNSCAHAAKMIMSHFESLLIKFIDLKYNIMIK